MTIEMKAMAKYSEVAPCVQVHQLRLEARVFACLGGLVGCRAFVLIPVERKVLRCVASYTWSVNTANMA
jgi:hypothetical protein